MSQIKYANSGQKITLFNISEDKNLKGSVIFAQKQLKKQYQVSSIKYQEVDEAVRTPNPGFLLMTDKKLVKDGIAEKPKKQAKKVEKFAVDSLNFAVSKVKEVKRVSKPLKKVSGKLANDVIAALKEPWFVIDKNIIVASKKAHSKLFLNLAAFCLIISLVSMTSLLLPLAIGEFQFRSGSNVKTVEQVIPENSYLRTTVHSSEGEKIPSEINQFKISIPKINLESEVVANVDPNSELDYETKLKYGVAHAMGSYLPGGKGPVYLFAHSTDTIFNITRFNAKFFAVKELVVGDEVEVIFNDKKYIYVISERQVIKPDQLDVIRASDSNLILQTCWPPGTNWERLVLFAELKSVTDI